MTIAEAKKLKKGDVVYDIKNLTKKGKPRQWRVAAPDCLFPKQDPKTGAFLDGYETKRHYPYRVRVLLKARFGEWETLSELELNRFSITPNVRN